MEIKRIGIAGAGTMGYSMADIFASYGFDVTLWNHRKPTLERVQRPSSVKRAATRSTIRPIWRTSPISILSLKT